MIYEVCCWILPGFWWVYYIMQTVWDFIGNRGVLSGKDVIIVFFVFLNFALGDVGMQIYIYIIASICNWVNDWWRVYDHELCCSKICGTVGGSSKIVQTQICQCLFPFNYIIATPKRYSNMISRMVYRRYVLHNFHVFNCSTIFLGVAMYIDTYIVYIYIYSFIDM